MKEQKERKKKEEEDRQRLEHEQAKAAVLQRLNQKKPPAKKKEAKPKEEETKDQAAPAEQAEAGPQATMSDGKVKIKIPAIKTDSSAKKSERSLDQDKEAVRKRDKKAASKATAQDERRGRE